MQLPRFLSLMLAGIIVLSAQVPEPKQLSISILEGEGAINNIRQRTAREAIVQVEDENHKPVAGAAVTFFLPDHGPTGVFSNGSRSITVLTDTNGRAAMRGMVPNKVVGKVEIRVTARMGDLHADAVITQTNVVGAGAAAGAISGKVIALIVIGAVAGTVAGVVAATRGGGASAVSIPPVVTITPGTPSVGHP